MVWASFVIAWFAGLALTPQVRGLARRWQFLDRPDAERKTQCGAVAFGGGVSVFLAATVAVLFSLCIDAELRALAPRAFWLLPSASLIVILGVLDDRFGMRGRHKLLGQIAASMLALASAPPVFEFDLLGWTIPLGVVGPLVALFWLLGSINAFNLIDGVDGLAGSVGLVVALALAVISAIQGQFFDSLIALSLAGGLLGFLPLQLGSGDHLPGGCG